MFDEEIQIEQGIAPLKKSLSGTQRRPKKYWKNISDAMQFGASVLVPGRSAAMSLALAIKRSGFRAQMEKQHNGKYRVWKLK